MVVLFGGATSSGLANTLEAWDGAQWRVVDAGQGSAPRPRSDAILVADPERDVLVLYGGRGGTGLLTDTWEWNGSTWRQLDVAGPSARVHDVAAYDRNGKRVVLYGGVGDDDVTKTDTWAWDGAAWTRLDDVGTTGVIPTGMAWDSLDGRVLLLAVDLAKPSDAGLYAGELWAWSGSAWKRVPGDGPAFSPMQSFVDGPRGPWLIDGGAAQDAFGTWEWVGDKWSSVDGPAPKARNGQSVAFDVARHQMVLFGGFADGVEFDDTWLLDDGAWREVQPG